jgi:hypothetical protein
MKRISVFILWCVMGFSQAKAVIPVVPLPQVVKEQKGIFRLSPAVTIRVTIPDTTLISGGLVELREAIRLYAGASTRFVQQGKAALHIGLPDGNAELYQICHKEGLWPDARVGSQGYVLAITSDQIRLAAREPVGLFYGLQTLVQLLRNSRDARLACMTVVDWPELAWRGILDDISRGPLPTTEFVKTQIRRCAGLKLNMLTYYTENITATPRHADFAPIGGGVTVEQWREWAEYAAKYHIHLVGNFQSFGHFEKILSYPQYQDLGEAGRMLTPTREESYRLLADIYADMAPAFSSPYFNVNCDEVWDLGRGDSKKMVDSLGLAGVYSYHLNRISAELKKHDKIMMMWADIALEHPEILAKLPAETILLPWNYDAADSFDTMIRPLANAGFKTMVCPGVLNSRRLMPDFTVARKNINHFIRDGKEHRVMGALTTVWDDGGAAAFSRDWYGVAFAADQSWSDGERAKAGFDTRVDKALYGNPRPTLAQAVEALAPLADLAATQEMNEAVFWSKIVPDPEEKLRSNLNDWYVVRDICHSADSLLATAAAKVYTTDYDYLKFSVRQYRFMAESRIQLQTAADLYRAACRHQSERDRVAAELATVLHLVSSQQQELAQLAGEFKKLWLLENRPYYLDRILQKYESKVKALDEVVQLLTSAAADFGKGQFLPPPNQVRLDMEESVSRYFTGWLMCGPFPNPQYSGQEVDYLASLGGEKAVRPTVWSETEWPQGRKMRWRKFNSPTPAEIDLLPLYENNKRVLAYAYGQIDCPQARKVMASFGSNDGIEIILNGRTIFKKLVKRNLVVDEDHVLLDLQQGKNHLLLKIYQGSGGWGFSFQMPNVTVRNHDHRYRIIEQKSN